jgi:hypothetical protein
MPQRYWQEGMVVGNITLAYQIWGNTTLVFRRVRRSSSWRPPTSRGGDSFTDKVAETIFLVFLNYIQAALKLFVAAPNNRSLAQQFALLIDHHIEEAKRIIKMSYWKDDYVCR